MNPNVILLLNPVSNIKFTRQSYLLSLYCFKSAFEFILVLTLINDVRVNASCYSLINRYIDCSVIPASERVNPHLYLSSNCHLHAYSLPQ